MSKIQSLEEAAAAATEALKEKDDIIGKLRRTVKTKDDKLVAANAELATTYQQLAEANGKLADLASTRKQLTEARRAQIQTTRRLLDLKAQASSSKKKLDHVHALTGPSKK
ncbi:hypothetical protein OC835_007707 [Tilletia horrida]|uniref:Uncharacterized protein n=1 Tax=Tilletia horrida TaxID=155126 RepID=A0AAN6G307_9BASI|nr:hypothetical protein OC842_007811 [Tilletia horrida]KAK0518891.1 hypothetical protein OC835_007707 [Tilletia horrida]